MLEGVSIQIPSSVVSAIIWSLGNNPISFRIAAGRVGFPRWLMVTVAVMVAVIQ